MVWIYGGAFIGGSTSYFNPSSIIKGSTLAGLPFIHVAMNYRISGFGFLASNETAERGALNLGIKDQRLALKWVNRYISYFGGDPNKVTIYGESAGAISVAYHLTAYGATKETNLFRAAILESGSHGTVRVPPASYWQPVYDKLVKDTGCSTSEDTFKCLQEVSYNTIAPLIFNAGAPSNAIGHFNFGPTLDYDLIPDAPYRSVQNGKFIKVPLIIGDNLDEGTGFTTYVDWKDEQTVRNQMQATYPDLTSSDLDTLLTLYPNNLTLGSPYNTGNRTYRSPQFKRGSSIVGDFAFVAPRRFMQDKYADSGVNVWSYRFDFATKLDQINQTDYVGVTHGDEVAAVYGAADIPVVRSVVGYWTAFATNLNPNIPTQPTWSAFNTTALSQIRFEQDQTILRRDDFRREQTNFMSSLNEKLAPFVNPNIQYESTSSSNSNGSSDNNNSNTNGGTNGTTRVSEAFKTNWSIALLFIAAFFSFAC
eukprot:TRINITY_DN5580_c0_g1_i2.p1 TRINITY_DN5580_c0_g1~~TRINITY_DN5580_c0_g1_i2.p1  ORF type:complete len:479 (+),score=149.75 TRINITY_DN5580_c0_g1_i2:197-1633(+)